MVLLYMLKTLYAVQPYQVGSKRGKSLVFSIPARIAKEWQIDTSTVFVLRTNEKNRTLTLQNINTASGMTALPSSQQTQMQ
jgi:hypothetical protein